MSSEFLEKIRNILEYLFELFIFILIMLITFGSLHVHAEESSDLPLTMVVTTDIDDSYNNQYGTITYTLQNNVDLNSYDVCAWYRDGKAFGSDTDTRSISFIWKRKSDNVISFSSSAVKVVSVDSTGTVVPKYGVGSTLQEITKDVSRYEDGTNKGFYPYYTFVSGNYPIAESYEAAENYLLTGDTSGIVNGGSDIDPHDDAYAFTGFSMSGKTATWTGTTERSYLLDMDVNEWVNYTYGFSTSEDQEVSTFIDAEANYPTSDKKLALPWDEMEANKKEGEFIRQVNIIPCYGTSGAGFYFGLPCKVFYHRDGSVDKVELPASNGILSSDMERPVIVLNEASNGSPVGGDYSYFRFNNAQDDYFIEMKGRWYSTNDFDIYRENLVWKYKYQSILKNDLSSWVSVSDSVNSVGSFRFDVLGKSSWENLLSLYPVDNRNYEGGSFALFNKITGYSDALDTLKMLLKQPYSLYNGYEIYVRYYRYDDNGNLQYSKWTHFYNNLADAAGSSGSRLDDLNNMYSENQSDKGLTDDELSDLENTGNSRNDLDAVPKNNYDYSSLENATMNFFDLLTNFGTMLGQFPSMVAAVFGFLPSWLIGLIAVAIGAVIVCRFIGR